jgi:hypothetical protein
MRNTGLQRIRKENIEHDAFVWVEAKNMCNLRNGRCPCTDSDGINEDLSLMYTQIISGDQTPSVQGAITCSCAPQCSLDRGDTFTYIQCPTRASDVSSALHCPILGYLQFVHLPLWSESFTCHPLELATTIWMIFVRNGICGPNPPRTVTFDELWFWRDTVDEHGRLQNYV